MLRVLLFTFLCWTSALAADELEAVTDQPEPESFSLLDVEGELHRLSDYRGFVVLVSFWATWCPQCIWEMPSLQSLSDTLPKGEFVVLAVNVGEERKTVKTFVQQNSITFPVLLDQDLETYKKWPVLGVPASFLIDGHGRLAYTIVGAIEWTNPKTLSKLEQLVANNKNRSDL